MKNDTLYKIIQDGEILFEALVVLKSIAFMIVVNLHNFQGQTKHILSSKETSFRRECEKSLTNLFKAATHVNNMTFKNNLTASFT